MHCPGFQLITNLKNHNINGWQGMKDSLKAINHFEYDIN